MVDVDFVEFVRGVDHVDAVKVAQDVQKTSSVPVVGDSAPVIYMARRVRQNLERNLVVLQQEHVQLRDADLQIPVGEFVRDVEAQRAEFAPFQQHGVEEAQREQQPLEREDFLVRGIEEFRLVRHVVQVRLQHVRFDSARRFHGHLASVLQDRDREMGRWG